MEVLVVGSVALDSVETPHAKRVDVLGGSASFFAVTGSILVPVRLVAVVGDDFPEEHVDLLRSRHVDLSGLQRSAGRTFRWSGRYLPDMVGRETLDTQLNVFADFRPQLPASFRDSRYVFLANIDPDLQLQVLQQVVQRPKLVACDTMNFWIRGKLESLKTVLRASDVILLNDEEVRLLSGEHSLVKAAAAVRQMGPQRVIVKRGDAGAMLFDEAGIFWTPAVPLTSVVDPTGAGDSFAGGFVSFLAHTDDLRPANLRRAMVYGSAIASFAVEDFSLDRFRTLQREAILARCRDIADLVRFEDIDL
jgi:sugar/nucleoside kinase (ribokinase family)